MKVGRLYGTNLPNEEGLIAFIENLVFNFFKIDFLQQQEMYNYFNHMARFPILGIKHKEKHRVQNKMIVQHQFSKWKGVNQLRKSAFEILTLLGLKPDFWNASKKYVTQFQGNTFIIFVYYSNSVFILYKHQYYFVSISFKYYFYSVFVFILSTLHMNPFHFTLHCNFFSFF